MTKIAKTAAQMCGLIIEELGWEAVFYITAGITILWVIMWQVGCILKRIVIVIVNVIVVGLKSLDSRVSS